MSTRTLKTSISVKVPPQTGRTGLKRLTPERRKMAVTEATKAFRTVLQEWGIEGEVSYVTSYSTDIERYARKLKTLKGNTLKPKDSSTVFEFPKIVPFSSEETV